MPQSRRAAGCCLHQIVGVTGHVSAVKTAEAQVNDAGANGGKGHSPGGRVTDVGIPARLARRQGRSAQVTGRLRHAARSRPRRRGGNGRGRRISRMAIAGVEGLTARQLGDQVRLRRPTRVWTSDRAPSCSTTVTDRRWRRTIRRAGRRPSGLTPRVSGASGGQAPTASSGEADFAAARNGDRAAGGVYDRRWPPAGDSSSANR